MIRPMARGGNSIAEVFGMLDFISSDSSAPDRFDATCKPRERRCA
jgi:hypothetical protein